jgi:hypothetical protein
MFPAPSGLSDNGSLIDMPSYRIHHLKDHLRQSFRQAPHVSGAANVKLRDYSPGDTVGAKSPYAAYFELRASATPIEPGDMLESDSGELRIFKFVGFEEARWVVPEAKADPSLSSTEAGPIPVTVE